MATQYIDLPAVKFGFIDEANPNTHTTVVAGNNYPVGGYKGTVNRSAFLIGFDDFPSNLQRNKLYGGQVTAYAPRYKEAGSFVTGNWFASVLLIVAEDFDASTVTFANYPAYNDGYSSGYDLFDFGKYSGGDYREETVPDSAYLINGSGTTTFRERKIDIVRTRSVRLARYGSSAADEFVYVSTKLANGSSLPFLRVYYDDAVVVTSKVLMGSGPSGGGYRNPADAIRFSWALIKDGYEHCYNEDFAQASATFYWKASGGSYTGVTISGSTTEVTIPGGTFPNGTTITYYVEVTDTDGTTSQTSEITFSTTDGTAVATPTAPIDIVKDSQKTIVFQWSLSNDNGTRPSRVELEWKDSGTWTTLMDENDDVTWYDVSGGTFPGGTVEWRVRAYNLDGVAGPWATASFVSLGGPAAPNSLTNDGVPYLTIEWQATGQEAFEVYVDGVSQGAQFGTAKTFTLEEPLTDGDHTIGVRVQGAFGLWSQISEQLVTITNTPGSSVTLGGNFGTDAELYWTTASTVEDFYIYRDGVRIGHAAGSPFTDRLCTGEHEWFILNRLTDGNYTKSNAVTGTLHADTTVIAELGSSAWIELALTENRQTIQEYSYGRTHSLRHVYGAAWPVLELSPYEDVSASFDTAFLPGAEAKSFEALKGKVVVLKTRDDTLVVGALTSIRKTVGDFYITYSFTLQRIHWEDYVDDQND